MPAWSYAALALIAGIVGIGLLMFYVYRVPALIQAGISAQVFYVLLIPWGIASSAFLFGAMRSYARFQYRQMGTVLELGGPVVLFALVVVGGFKLVPPVPETFDLTVRPKSEDGSTPILTAGRVTIDLGNRRDTVALDARGEANFKGVPASFHTMPVNVLAVVDGFEERWQKAKATGTVIELPLKRSTPMSRLTGAIVPVPGQGKEIKLLVDGGLGAGGPDSLGRFDILVRGKDGERIRLKVYVDGQLRYDDYQTLPGPITLRID
jgi:hypothetical protein